MPKTFTKLKCPNCGVDDKVAKKRCCGGRLYKCYSCAFSAEMKYFTGEAKLPSQVKR